MNKKKLARKRVVLAQTDSLNSLCKGMTGITANFTAVDGSLIVLFDGREEPMGGFVESDLYFPDSNLGYNQKCFQ